METVVLLIEGDLSIVPAGIALVGSEMDGGQRIGTRSPHTRRFALKANPNKIVPLWGFGFKCPDTGKEMV